MGVLREVNVMPQMKPMKVDELTMDLDNFRMTHQDNEVTAINAMISIRADWFWALLDSIIEDGYHPSENIIVLQQKDGKNIVKDGNRRIAALKIIHGQIKDIDLPSDCAEKVKSISATWVEENSSIPCSIYKENETDKVNRIISLIHAKGEKAGRDTWTSVARARFNRDQRKQKELGLDLLEKYLKSGRNLTGNQAECWGGDYPLTVLDEAITKLFEPLGYKTLDECVKDYPKKNKRPLDSILYNIGVQHLRFKEIRDKNIFFGDPYGIKLKKQGATANVSTTSPGTTSSGTGSTSTSSRNAVASNDPRAVYLKLRLFTPKGKGREKLVTLLNEMKLLKLEKHPHSFCFLLRSMFEISAKAYCDDYASSGGPKIKKADGKDKTLAQLLKDITKHLTKNNSDKDKVKQLHGAITEISKKEGILSVTSMNHLVHNTSFSIQPNDIAILFGNIYPLLEEMNNK